MNEFDRVKRDCEVGIKAFHNVRTAHLAFERVCSLVESLDHLMISSVFQHGVVRYAKPFVDSRRQNALIRYPTKSLKKVTGFSSQVHEHLLKVRHRLVAHDDFEDLESRILLLNMRVRPTDFCIPVRIIAANKVIAYPKDLGGATMLQNHAAAALRGIQEKLYADMGKLRQVALNYPEQISASTRYSADYGKQEIAVGGTRANLPDLSSDPWLSAPEPDFSTVHGGFIYETMRTNRDFFGPETIHLPDGRYIKLTPDV